MMKKNSDNTYSNEHLFYEILVRIFTTLSVVDLTVASMVCKSWNLASRAPQLWTKLDISTLNSKGGLYVPLRPFAWIDECSSQKMTRFLKYTSGLGGESINCIIFNYYAYLRDVHLITIAERTPNLKRLVFPLSGNISKIGIETAMRSWRDLESITITSVVHHANFFEAVRKYCMNIVSLKLTTCFEEYEAIALVNYTPNLKVLSLRNINVNMKGLCHVLNSLEHLEVVNLSHSLILDTIDDELQSYSIDDVLSRVNVSCKLIICQRRTCPRCNNPRRVSYGTLEDIWHEDEIRSLSH